MKARETVRAKPLVCMRAPVGPPAAPPALREILTASLKLGLHHRRGSHRCKSDSGFAHVGVCAARKLFEDDAG